MKTIFSNEYLTPREACELLPGVSYQSFLRWLREGKVPYALLPNGRKLVRRFDVEALLAVHEKTEGSALFSEPQLF